MVEQLAPLPGMAIAPGTPAGAGLIPGDAISVEPRGMPVGETVDPVSMPSGEVAPMVGVGLAIPPTWAIAALQTRSGERTAAINESLIGVLRLSRKMARAREPFNQFGRSPRGGMSLSARGAKRS